MEKRARTIIIVTAILLAVITVAIIGTTAMQAIPANRVKRQHQTEALTEQITEVPVQPSASGIASASVGEIITFGAFEQDNNAANGAEEIEWQVLDRKDGRLLVISLYGLDCRQYNETYTFVTWETCSLRSWLNSDFYNTAFNESEKESIKTTTINNPDNADYGTSGGNTTNDKVFCLSIDEAKAYFGADSKDSNGNTINPYGAAKPTAYAVSMGAYADTPADRYGMNCYWWLRSPGDNQSAAAGVNNRGNVIERGGHVNYGIYAVRPALWIEP